MSRKLISGVMSYLSIGKPGSLGSYVNYPVAVTTAILLILFLCGCESKNLERTSVDESYIVVTRDSPKYVAVMMEDGAIYCLAGKIRSGNHTLKAGRCLKGNREQAFSVVEFVNKFPSVQLTYKEVAEEVARENSRSRDTGKGL